MSNEKVTPFRGKDKAKANQEEFEKSMKYIGLMMESLAKTRKHAFDCHVKAGFTEAQALELVKSLSL